MEGNTQQLMSAKMVKIITINGVIGREKMRVTLIIG